MSEGKKKEVSCRTFIGYEQRFRLLGLDSQILTHGIPYDLAYLRKKHERIEWSTYCRLTDNARRVWGPDDFEAFGYWFATSRVFRPAALVAGLLFTVDDLYQFMVTYGGPGSQMFQCIHGSVQRRDAKRIRVTVRLEQGHRFLEEFFVTTKGSFAALPQLLGLPPAEVEMTLRGDVAVYDVTHAQGAGGLAWARRAVTWPLTARRAARELKEAHEVLLKRYDEIERARFEVDRQATQLRTAHTISQVIHAGLDLDHTLQAIANAIVEVAGFAAADVAVTSDIVGRPLAHHVRHGKPPSGEERITWPIELRGQPIGELQLWLASGADSNERQELLQFVGPTFDMAVGNALTFNAVVDYRNNLERKVEERTMELEQALSSLREAQSGRERFFANISHEIRTPLSLITLAVDAIGRSDDIRLDERSRQCLRDVQANVQHVLRLVDGLLLLAAGQEGQLRLRPVDRDLAAVLRSLVSAWEPATAEHGLQLSFSGPKRCMASVDAVAFDQMVTNLLANALKYTPRGGEIDVGLREMDQAQVEIAVRDTGIGIPEELQERIFERFEQGQTPVRTGPSGSGIGLAIVKELVEAHGGTVKLESTPGGGSCFSLVLPHQHESREPSPGTQQMSSDALVADSSHSEAPAILVVEDHPDLRRALSDLLGKSFRIATAGDGETALRLAEAHRYQMLLTDIRLPGMDGLTLIRRFRELPDHHSTPVIVLTAYGPHAEGLLGLEANVVDCVLKPFSPEKLLTQIRSHLAPDTGGA